MTTNEGPSAAEADYYVENGCLVFTARYLLKRGYCCGNRCRHCPYTRPIHRQRAGDGRGPPDDSPA